MDLTKLGMQVITNCRTEANQAIEVQKNLKNLEKLKQLRKLLEKPSDQRIESDIDKLVVLIKDHKFFKERGELLSKDIRDLAAAFQFCEIEQYEDVVTYGDVGNHFYMIIKGTVSVQIPNPDIKKWDNLRKEYEKLKNWKHEEFDPKMRKAKK